MADAKSVLCDLCLEREAEVIVTVPMCGERPKYKVCPECVGDLGLYVEETKIIRLSMRDHWWQTPPGNIPYGNRLLLGVVMGVLFAAMGVSVVGWPGAFFGLLPLGLVVAGVYDEWQQGY